MTNWKPYKLGDFADVQTGPFGSQLHAHDYVDYGIPSIMPVNIVDHKIVEENIVRITEKDAQRLRKYLVAENDIVFSRRGEIHRRALISDKENGWLCGTGCLRARFTDLEKVDPTFLYYYIGLDAVRDWLYAHAVGTSMPNLNSGILANLPINLPDLPTQQKIAEILSELDYKIDINHRINYTLEKIAQTLYHQYFVEGVDADNLKEGWKREKLRDYVNTITGFSYKSKDLLPSKNALVTLKNFARKGGFRLDGFKEYVGGFKESQVVFEGDLAVAHTDVTQNAELIGNPILIANPLKYEKLIVSTDLVKVDSKFDWLSNEYLYYLMRDSEFKNYCLAHTNGTTVLHLGKSSIPNYIFNLPPTYLIKKFTNEVKPLIAKFNLNINEVFKLEQLRNTLLPKLMSGEIDVMQTQTAGQYEEVLS